MKSYVRRNWRPIAVATVVLSLTPSAEAQNPPPLPLRLTAVAVNMSNVGRAGASRLDITINRWSTDAERQGLLTTFVEKGPEKLLDALQDAKPVGRINAPGTLGWELRAARYAPLPEGGSRIILVTDRPINFWEARAQPRVSDYPFTLIEIRLKPDGSGDGKASIATKITYNKKTQTIELENYASEPLRLNDVKIEK